MHYAGKLVEWAFGQQRQEGTAPLPAGLNADGYRLMRDMQKGQVQALVGGLARPCAAWARFAYTVEGGDNERSALLRYCLANFRYYGAPPSRIDFDRWERALAVFDNMIDNARLVLRGQPRRWSKAALAEVLGLGADRFKPAEYWGRLDAAVLAMMAALDREVAAVVMGFAEDKLGPFRHLEVA